MTPLKQRSLLICHLLITFFILSSCNQFSSDLLPVKLRTEYKTDPIVDAKNPSLSLELTSEVRGQVLPANAICMNMLSSEMNNIAG